MPTNADTEGVIDGVSSASSGMAYAATVMGVAASNVANVDTTDFSASEVSGGPTATAVASTGQPTDLATQLPMMAMAQTMMEANVAVMKKAQDMYASVLQLLPH